MALLDVVEQLFERHGAVGDRQAGVDRAVGQHVHLTRDGIVVFSDKTIRLEGKDIELAASESFKWDVNGFGERWKHTGGANYEHRTWQTGATVSTVTGAINPPEGP